MAKVSMGSGYSNVSGEKERLLGSWMAGGGWLELEGVAGWKGCLGVKLEAMEMMIQQSLGRDIKGAKMGVDSSTGEAGGSGEMAGIMVVWVAWLGMDGDGDGRR